VESASRLVSVGAAGLAKASSEGWRLRLRPNKGPPCFRVGSSGPIFVLFGLDTTRAKTKLGLLGPIQFSALPTVPNNGYRK
jgi:hypothetical protein